MLKTLNCFGRSVLVIQSLLLFSSSSTLAQRLPPPPTEEDQEVYQFNAPDYAPSAPAPSNSGSDTMFRVQVYGNSEELLSLVRRVEPDAFVPEGKNVIQAGLFFEAMNARELVESLSKRGIRAEIIEVAKPLDLSSQSNSSAREMISLSPPATSKNSPPAPLEFIPLAVETASDHPEVASAREVKTRAYYVVIPSRQQDLLKTAQAVQAVGINENIIQQRNAPRGTHVAVGPFPHREEASHWSSQLQTEGLNARVYFGR